MAKPDEVPSPALIQVLLVYSPAPRVVLQWPLSVPRGTTVAGVLALGALETAGFSAAPLSRLKAGVWGQKCSLDRILKQGDRLEVYRPLRVDPKVARRERFNRQGAKTTGLFAKSRPGSKAGY